jgi:hypothetical protein
MRELRMKSIHKLGIDIHGMTDADPVFWSAMTRALYAFHEVLPNQNLECFQIHVMTGSSLKDGKIKKWLEEKNIKWTHIFSISDYLKEKGYPELEKSTPENPWYDDEIWNVAKAHYSAEHNLDLVLDDNDDYFPHFRTPIARYYSKGKEKQDD